MAKRQVVKDTFDILAKNFRGFRRIEATLGDVTFVVGDNSSGKTTILRLVDLILTRSFAMDFDLFSSNTKFTSSSDILSPYIADPRVTIGMVISKETSKKLEVDARIATYKNTGNRSLKLEKVVYASENRARFILSKTDGIVRKDLPLKGNKRDVEAILKEHNRPSGNYAKFRIPGLGKLPNLMILALADYDLKSKNFNVKFSDTIFPHRIYGPIRMDPEHAYSGPNVTFDERGRHTPALLKRIFSNRIKAPSSRSVIRQINKFGAESGMFDKLFVTPYSKSDPKAPFRIEVKKKGKTFSLDEVGYGVSQILPIIVDAITANRDQHSLFLIQQPELHLHPKAQAAFGELLFNLGQLGLRFLIETHSDYIINRYRHRLHRSATQLETKIFFCENTPRGNRLNVIDIDHDGTIKNAPPKYRSFFLKEEDKLFEII